MARETPQSPASDDERASVSVSKAITPAARARRDPGVQRLVVADAGVGGRVDGDSLGHRLRRRRRGPRDHRAAEAAGDRPLSHAAGEGAELHRLQEGGQHLGASGSRTVRLSTGAGIGASSARRTSSRDRRT